VSRKKFDPMAGFEPGKPLETPEPPPEGEVGFTMDIEANMALIQDIMSGVTRDKGQRAMAAGQKVEKALMGIMNDHIGDGAASLGICYAVHKIAKLLVNGDRANQQKGQGLIQLLQ
jgi:hypothetical protein